MDSSFRLYSLLIPASTPIMSIMVVLDQVGVLISGRYSIRCFDSGTRVTYFATPLQNHIINALIKELKADGIIP